MLPLIVSLCDLSNTLTLSRVISSILIPGMVITLSGDIGSGKTAFARLLIQLLVKRKSAIPSPTFTIVQVYNAGIERAIWHFDLYRIRKPEEVLELGIEEAIPNGITIIEWPERLGKLQPSSRLDVTLAFLGSAEKRQALLRGYGEFPLHQIAQKISKKYCQSLCVAPTIKINQQVIYDRT